MSQAAAVSNTKEWVNGLDGQSISSLLNQLDKLSDQLRGHRTTDRSAIGMHGHAILPSGKNTEYSVDNAQYPERDKELLACDNHRMARLEV